MSRFFRMFRFFRRSGNDSPTSGNVSLYEQIITGFYMRLEKLEAGEKDLIDKDLGERVGALAAKVNAQYERQHPGKGVRATPAPTTYRELGRTLHGIMTRLGELEADRLVLPPSMKDRQEFREKLKLLTPEEMADQRYLGVWGHYDPRDARKSDWQVIEANRFITKGQAKADASRERRLALFGIIVAFAVGIVAAGAAVLAIPTKDSIFCQVVACDKKFRTSPDPAVWVSVFVADRCTTPGSSGLRCCANS